MIRTMLRGTLALAVALALGAAGTWLWVAVRYHLIAPLAADTAHSCARIPGVAKPEDVAVDTVRGGAFVSGSGANGRAVPGLYRVDFSGGQASLTNAVAAPPPLALQPHGLSLYTGPDGRQTLFVVNHAAQGHQIMIFDVQADGRLMWRSTLRDPALYSPNDVAAVSPSAFYVSNATRAPTAKTLATAWGRLKALLNFPATGNVAYFDGVSFHTVADGFKLANGVSMSPDGKYVLVSETFGQRVSIFRRDGATNALRLERRVALPGGPDNIDSAPDGTFYVAVTPRLPDLLAYTRKMSLTRPATEIVRLDPREWKVNPVWRDNGTKLAAISSGVAYRTADGRPGLLFGNISPDDNFVLNCTEAKR